MPTSDALGPRLVESGTLTQAQLDEAIALQRQTGRLLGTCIVDLELMSPESLLAVQSRLFDIPPMTPGLLAQSEAAARTKVPGPLARRLNIVPYSWDGSVLGVAVADARVLDRLHEVGEHTQVAVGAYLALERELEAALLRFYPVDADVRAKVIRSAPPAVSKASSLERVSFYDATAQIYEAKSVEAIGLCIGSALLNYFQRVLVLRCDATQLTVTGHAGAIPARKAVPWTAVPGLVEGHPRRYGESDADPRFAAFVEAVGLRPAATALVAFVGPASAPRLMLYADNGDVPDLYEDIHDIEGLLKDADTAVGMAPG